MTPAPFARESACAILGIHTSLLESWELGAWGGRENGRFTLSDLVALAVTREMAVRLGPRLSDFALGVRQLFSALAARPDVERADDLSAVIGHRFAFLWQIPAADTCGHARDIVVVPLHPLLAELRDQAFP